MKLSENPAVLSPKPPRFKLRWFQFSLRAMFAGMTLICVLLGTVVHYVIVPAERQRAAVQAIEKVEGKRALGLYPAIEYADAPRGQSTVMEWLRGCLPKDYVKPVVSVRLAELDDTGLINLRAFSQLRYASLHGPKVTDSGLVHIQELTQLESLDLSYTKVTDAGLQNLKCLVNLKHLYLCGLKVTGSGLAHIHELTELETLILSNTRVSDAGVQNLKSLVKLKHLDLCETSVTDSSIQAIRKNLPDCQVFPSTPHGSRPVAPR